MWLRLDCEYFFFDILFSLSLLRRRGGFLPFVLRSKFFLLLLDDWVNEDFKNSVPGWVWLLANFVGWIT